MTINSRAYDEKRIEEIKAHLSDRKWRLNNLYYIIDITGKKVLFKMNAVQEFIFDNMWFFNIIPKARQLGVTTFFALFYLDQILFSENKAAGIIAHKEKDAKKIFKTKIKFAWDNLHPWLKEKIGSPSTDTVNELVFPNGSSIYVSTSTRASTLQFLHISEFGPLCAKFPDKAEEIVTGAINSVHAGQMVSIESTAAGKEGYFYNFCMQAEKDQMERKRLSPLEFKLFFFAWYLHPDYHLPIDGTFSEEDAAYFNKLDVQGIRLTNDQKWWYVKKKSLMGEKMLEEYPATLDEAFSSSVEGAYYAQQFKKVFKQGRITNVPFDPTYPVDTWWDLGMDDTNVIGLVQSVGPQIRFIDCVYGSGEGLEYYVKELSKKAEEQGYRYRRHILPHDAKQREMGTGKDRVSTLMDLGLRNIVVAAKLPVLDGIDRVRLLFGRFWFDDTKAKKIHEWLFNYRKDWDDKLGTWKRTPRHDENSHGADMVRTGCQLWREDLIGFDDDGEGTSGDQSFWGS